MANALRITHDLVYGQGRIHVNSIARYRPLTLDLYQSADCRPGDARPALVMAFGGAFHRGDKRNDEFEQGDQRNTPVADYCRAFAERGYVTASIDYRLVPEDPDPGDTPVIGSPDRVPLSRVSHVRRLMGLPPATAQMVWAGNAAATDDMAMAVRYLVSQAGALGIDPARIAIGGFSAGARTALNCAYGEQVGAAAVVSLSGFMADDDLTRWVHAGANLPPALLVSSEHDLDYIRAQAEPMRAHMAACAVACESWRVPAAGHFYPAGSEAVKTDGGHATVMQAMAAFLTRSLGAV